MSFLFIPSGGELVLVAIVVLLLFGADKIPEIMRMVSKGMNEFRSATDDIKREFRESTEDLTKDLVEEKKAIQSDIEGYKKDIKDELSFNESEEDYKD